MDKLLIHLIHKLKRQNDLFKTIMQTAKLIMLQQILVDVVMVNEKVVVVLIDRE